MWTHHSRLAQTLNICYCRQLVLYCPFLFLLSDLAVPPDPGLLRRASAWPGADHLDKWLVCPLSPAPGLDREQCLCSCPSLASCHRHKWGRSHQSILSLLREGRSIKKDLLSDILFSVGPNNVKTYQGHNRKAKQQPELAPEA